MTTVLADVDGLSYELKCGLPADSTGRGLVTELYVVDNTPFDIDQYSLVGQNGAAPHAATFNHYSNVTSQRIIDIQQSETGSTEIMLNPSVLTIHTSKGALVQTMTIDVRATFNQTGSSCLANGTVTPGNVVADS